MIKSQAIRDYYNRVIGYIDTDDQGNKIIRDYYHKMIGRYDKKQDVTRDLYNRIVGKGDLSTMLFRAK